MRFKANGKKKKKEKAISENVVGRMQAHPHDIGLKLCSPLKDRFCTVGDRALSISPGAKRYCCLARRGPAKSMRLLLERLNINRFAGCSRFIFKQPYCTHASTCETFGPKDKNSRWQFKEPWSCLSAFAFHILWCSQGEPERIFKYSKNVEDV